MLSGRNRPPRNEFRVPLKGTVEWPVLTLDAAFLSSPRVSAKTLVLFVVCGKRGLYSEDDVQRIIATHVATCAEAGLDPLLVVSQLLLETYNLTSASAQLPRLDPVGIRSSNKPNARPWFSSWAEAARAHAGLLLAYALPKGAESRTQFRLLEEALESRPLPARLRGSAPTIERLAGTWTADKHYPERILRIANTILEPQW